jgi:hypothetical protein
MKAFKKLQEEIQLVIAESKQKYVEVDTTRGIVQQFFFQMDKPSSKKVKVISQPEFLKKINALHDGEVFGAYLDDTAFAALKKKYIIDYVSPGEYKSFIDSLK